MPTIAGYAHAVLRTVISIRRLQPAMRGNLTLSREIVFSAPPYAKSQKFLIRCVLSSKETLSCYIVYGDYSSNLRSIGYLRGKPIENKYHQIKDTAYWFSWATERRFL